MKKYLSNLWDGFLNIFGLKKNSKYVKGYLNEANMRSGVFMSFVIFVLEIWLVIRQADKYVIPKIVGGMNGFEAIFKYTSLYFVMMFFGAAMFMYSLQYLSNKKSISKMIVPIVFAGLSIALCCLLPFEFIFKSISINGTMDAVSIQGILKLVFYGSVFLFDVGIIFSSIYRFRGGKRGSISSVMVISLFALVCLTFGVMVSYGDFISSTVYPNVNTGYVDKKGNEIVGDVIMNDKSNKQIICFLMFSIYIGCLLIWNPLISIGILGSLFLGFYLLLSHATDLGKRLVPEGDQVNYITFFISLAMVAVSIYNQRLSEAKKDEELEELATVDKLTGLYTLGYFRILAEQRIKEENIQKDEYAYLFINISNFKVYNDQMGFEKGNEFLIKTGEILKEVFPGSLISRQSDDRFIVFTRNEEIVEKINLVNLKVESIDSEIKLSVMVGINILIDDKEYPQQSIEKARYAYAECKQSKSGKRFAYYDEKMHDQYLMGQYVVSHIDEAIEKGYIKAYYQPVVWSKGRTLCGAEALARWIDPKFGFLSPAKFVPALENAQLIYKLDKAILRLVCQDLRRNIDQGLPALPVSINFSRADFGVMDIVEVVKQTVDEFDIPHDLLHIEITESALTDEEDLLSTTIHRLHENGFAMWLDDFGSGYSSFNVLKDYEFDVLKLDMKFLVGFNGNAKAKSLISSVINMANEIGMKTLCEGVETMEQAEFLESASCGRLQGYLYGKPLTYDDIMGKIASGYYTVSTTLN